MPENPGNEQKDNKVIVDGRILLPKTIDKMEGVKALIDTGKTAKEAISIMGYAPKSVDAIKTRFKKYLLTSPALLKKGRSATEKILDDYIEDKPSGNIKAALRLVEMQQDRIDPSISRHQVQQDTRIGIISYDDRQGILASLRRYKTHLPPDIMGEPQHIVADGSVESGNDGDGW